MIPEDFPGPIFMTNRNVIPFPNKTDVTGKNLLSFPSAEISAGIVNSLDAVQSSFL